MTSPASPDESGTPGGGRPPAAPLSGRRLLVTGASGQIASALCRRLVAAGNQVWGVARFGDEGRRRELEDAGVTTCSADLVDGDLAVLPDDIDHVLHLAAYIGSNPDTDYSMDVNALATGRVLSRYRHVDSALVMSTGGVYRVNPDPWHQYAESDPLGDPASIASPAYGVTKVAQEGVAKFCAREFGLRVVIGRMNVAYGAGGGMPARHLGLLLAGETIRVHNDPAPYSPIHEDDIARHVGPLLAAADIPALVVNFGGDEVVTAQQWCAYLAELAGVEARLQPAQLPGGPLGSALDPTRRLAITGPDQVRWRDGIRRMFELRAPLGANQHSGRR
jgi:nucleoside-diphosphate-sugar epimerase